MGCRSVRVLGWVVGSLVLLFVAACSGAPIAQPRALQPPPAAVAAVAAKQPTIVRVQGNLWVVGLPARHGWARGRHVLLTKRDGEHGIDVKVGVVVVLDDSYATAAPVAIVYEDPGESFDGVLAKMVGSDERLRIGRGFGSLSQVVTTSLVELDLGRLDGVRVGDVYEVRGREGIRSIGRVRVVGLEDTRAKAEVINAGPFVKGLEVVYQPRSAEEQVKGAAVTIVVCDFDPRARDKDDALAGKAFAHDLAKHLRQAVGDWTGLEVKQVPQIVGNDEQARKLGRDYRADIVVWGTAMCLSGKGCALPVFTVVEPERLSTAHFEGREVRFDALDPQGSLERGTVRDPAGLVFWLLGSLAFEAQRYGDVAFYLGRVPEGALEGVAFYSTLRDLGQAQYFLGRLESAMDTAVRLERSATGVNRGWAMVGVGQRAQILNDKGEVDKALKLLLTALADSEARGDRRARAVVLGYIARILMDKGEVDKALALLRESLAEFDARGDRRSRAVMLGYIARILMERGYTDDALKLLEEKRTICEALGNRRSCAVTLADIARVHMVKGAVDEALKLHREEMATYEALGDRRSRAMTLVDIAGILKHKGEVDEALKLLREAQKVFEALGDRRSRARTLGEIARIFTDKREIDTALTLHREVIVVYELLGDRRSRAVTLFDIAKIYLSRNEVDRALEMLKASYEIALDLDDAYGTAFVGRMFAETLVKAGAKKTAEPVIARVSGAMIKIGKHADAEALLALIAPRLIRADTKLYVRNAPTTLKRSSLLYARALRPLPGSAAHPKIGILRAVDREGDSLVVTWFTLLDENVDAALDGEGLPVDSIGQDIGARIGRHWGEYVGQPAATFPKQDRDIVLELNMGRGDDVRLGDQYDVLAEPNADPLNRTVESFKTLGTCTVLSFSADATRSRCQLKHRAGAPVFSKQHWGRGGYVRAITPRVAVR